MHVATSRRSAADANATYPTIVKPAAGSELHEPLDSGSAIDAAQTLPSKSTPVGADAGPTKRQLGSEGMARHTLKELHSLTGKSIGVQQGAHDARRGRAISQSHGVTVKQ